jgi:hypothetical protein
VSATSRHLLVVEVITANVYGHRRCRGGFRELCWKGKYVSFRDVWRDQAGGFLFVSSVLNMSKGLSVEGLIFIFLLTGDSHA